MYSPAIELRPFIEAVKAALLVERPTSGKVPPDVGVLPPPPYRDDYAEPMHRSLGAVRSNRALRADQ